MERIEYLAEIYSKESELEMHAICLYHNYMGMMHAQKKYHMAPVENYLPQLRNTTH